MGSSPSKSSAQPAAFDEKRAALADLVSNIASLHISATPQSADGSLSNLTVSSWEAEAKKDPKTKLARTILQHSDISSALTARSARIADTHIFNHVVDFKTGPITNQKSSGRCWIFASTNVFRYSIMKALKLSEFELSQVFACLIGYPVQLTFCRISLICFSGIS